MVHVDYCPLHIRDYKGKPYANYIDDCSICEHYKGHGGNEVLWIDCDLAEDDPEILKIIENEP